MNSHLSNQKCHFHFVDVNHLLWMKKKNTNGLVYLLTQNSRKNKPLAVFGCWFLCTQNFSHLSLSWPRVHYQRLVVKGCSLSNYKSRQYVALESADQSSVVFSPNQGWKKDTETILAIMIIYWILHKKKNWNDYFARLTVVLDGPLTIKFLKPPVSVRLPLPRDTWTDCNNNGSKCSIPNSGMPVKTNRVNFNVNWH